MPIAPLVVKLVYHPASPLASDLALNLYRQLNDDPAVPGLRIPTIFIEDDGSGEPPPNVDLPGEAQRVAVVLLAEDHLAAAARRTPFGQGRWGEYVVQLRQACSQSGHRFIPIQLSEHAWPIDPRLDDLNFLRAWAFDDKNVREAFVARRIVRALCKHLDAQSSGEDVAPVTIFVSHTKLDIDAEPKVVRALLALLTAAQPEKTWFDSGDIDAGSQFAREIEHGITDTAMIAVLTDAYASRAWCRREVLLAKKHRRPVIVVNALRGGEARSFPYVGNVPVLMWSGDPQAAVDLLLREALRHKHALALLEPRRRADDEVLPSPPELVTIIEGGARTVLYPDPPLGEEETALISMAGVKIETPLERFANDAREKKPSAWSIALSASESEDLPRHGFRPVHLESVYIELSRYLLLAGARLAYGGHLGARSYTLRLFDLLREPLVERLHRSNLGRRESPLISYIGWPMPLTVHDEARFGMLVELRRIGRPHDIDESLDPRLVPEPNATFDADNAACRFAWARGMTGMREQQTKETQARVVLGGKLGPGPGHREGWYASRIPGVLEEVLVSMQVNQPVFLIGAFGGCAQLAFDLLEGRSRREMTSDYQDHAPYALEMRALYEQRHLAWWGYPEMTSFLRGRGLAGLNNGLSDTENRELATTRSVERIVELVLSGLATSSSRQAGVGLVAQADANEPAASIS